MGTFKNFIAIVIFIFTPCLVYAQSVLEDPFPGANESGIGLIRGWVCNASKVEVAIDGGAKILTAYGTTRQDTFSVCKDSNNGFGIVINWNLFGTGTHSIVAYADNVAFASATFHIQTLGQEFLTGIQSAWKLPDFPTPGTDTIIQWEEAKQNFVITQTINNGGGGGGGRSIICSGSHTISGLTWGSEVLFTSLGACYLGITVTNNTSQQKSFGFTFNAFTAVFT